MKIGATIQIRKPDMAALERSRRESRAELVRFYRAFRETGRREVAMALFHTRRDIDREILAAWNNQLPALPGGLRALLEG